jgi:hypothetical protein
MLNITIDIRIDMASVLSMNKYMNVTDIENILDNFEMICVVEINIHTIKSVNLGKTSLPNFEDLPNFENRIHWWRNNFSFNFNSDFNLNFNLLQTNIKKVGKTCTQRK